jgi:2-oxoglutarate dehydrogenase E1 component
MLGAANLNYIEDLYARFRRDPETVSERWREYFAAMDGDGMPAPKIGPAAAAPETSGPPLLLDQLSLMIDAFRRYGHTAARIDPLSGRAAAGQRLDLPAFGFTDAHNGLLVPAPATYFGGPLTIVELHERLISAYCGTIAVEFMHIDDEAVRKWVAQRMESGGEAELSPAERMAILSQLTNAATFEEFIQKKFRGAKSFSLEGGEALLPLLHFGLARAAELGVLEVVVAMAHRGRLNVLANVIGKPAWQIFQEFDDARPGGPAVGDVKYHLGHSADYQTSSGRKVHVSLCFNPSHLEFVNPVAMGRVRAKQDRTGDAARERGLALMIHGDAAFAGEGVSQETLNLSGLTAYTVGGTVHVVLNNQIGFTTCPEEGRSSRYATDVAKMLQSPIFHVNGDDPEAVVRVARWAMDFRSRFKRDVFIDLICYRRLGHNESDEPSFTQPLLSRLIDKHESVRELYLQRLSARNEINAEQAGRMRAERMATLESELAQARAKDSVAQVQAYSGLWSDFHGGLEAGHPEPATALAPERARALLEAQTRLPKDFSPHPKILRALQNRRDMAAGNKPLDWSSAEALAFTSLAADGIRVRLSGQDSARGTFSQRHAVLHDYKNGSAYEPLEQAANGRAPVEIYNSPLSETGVLAFEYGYSLDYPDALVLWEAQFGDFANAAQVIIDQFITSAEEKWHRLSGIVLLLPHGFEGSGPEHSSARMERFLQLCVQDNIQVIYPSTAAQYFHCLRRQGLRKWRKPLVIMTPKSLLRNVRAASPLSEFSQGGFRRILPDMRQEPRVTEKILLCSGKIYYDLAQARDHLKRDSVAILRLEQLYPLSDDELRRHLAPYATGTPAVWVQEEPQNMGAWPHIRLRFGGQLLGRHPLSVICRPPAASPATGSARVHHQQQERIVADALESGAKPGEERIEELAL